MVQLLIVLTVLVSSSAFAEMSQFYNNHVGGTVYGQNPNAVQRYSDSRETVGTIFTSPQPGISQYYFYGPRDMMRSSGTIFDAPMGNTPMGMPQSAPQIMTPNQPFGSGLAPSPFGR